MYHLTSFLVIVLSLISGPGVLAQTEAAQTTLAYDTHYDEANLSLNDVACSNGQYGLERKGYTTLGSLPTFPNVGGAFSIAGWDSQACGSCYAVTYANVTVNILAVDVSQTGFTVSQTAMNTLTGNLSVELGRISVSYCPVSASACKL